MIIIIINTIKYEKDWRRNKRQGKGWEMGSNTDCRRPTPGTTAGAAVPAGIAPAVSAASAGECATQQVGKTSAAATSSPLACCNGGHCNGHSHHSWQPAAPSGAATRPDAVHPARSPKPPPGLAGLQAAAAPVSPAACTGSRRAPAPATKFPSASSVNAHRLQQPQRQPVGDERRRIGQCKQVGGHQPHRTPGAGFAAHRRQG